MTDRKIVIEYDAEDLKVLVAEILSQKLYTHVIARRNWMHSIETDAIKQVKHRIAEQIAKEVRGA